MTNKLFYKENKNFLSKKNIQFINNTVLTNGFPFYLVNAIEDSKKLIPVMGHIVLNRLEKIHLSKCINSPHYDETVDILNSFFKSINEKPNFYTRIAYNLTFNNGLEKSHTHVDHDNFNHKQIIIYLNDCDKESSTCIVDKKDRNKVIKTIEPEKNKGICFDSFPHYMIFPKSGLRIILVATYI